MLRRFKDLGGCEELPLEVQDVMVNWADFTSSYQRHRRIVNDALDTALMLRLQKKLIFGEEVSAVGLLLDGSAPDLLVAANGLQRALKNMQGWQLNWQNFVRGEVIEVNEVPNEAPADSIYQTTRGPNTYEEDTAWVVDAHIGYEASLNEFGARIAINYLPDQSNGLYISLFEMHEIEFRQPANP